MHFVFLLLVISISASLARADSKRIECLSADKMLSLIIEPINYQTVNANGNTEILGLGKTFTLNIGRDKIVYGSVMNSLASKRYGTSYEVQVAENTKGSKTILQKTKIDTGNRSGNFELGDDILTLVQLPVSDLEKLKKIDIKFNWLIVEFRGEFESIFMT